MAGFAPWDIVKVPFPFTEGVGDKRRPALIISAKELGREHKLYWLMMITSVVAPGWTGDVTISDFKAVGLPVPSVIRTAKIATLQEDRILGTLGKLAPRERKSVRAAIGRWLME